MPVDDYYSLMGVSPDASRDQIRDAYRLRRDETGDESAKAQLNRAWNVLSDTAQRERYDDQLAAARLDDDVVVPELIVGGASTNGSSAGDGRPKTRAQMRRERMQNAQGNRPQFVQETHVGGRELANNKDRMFAFAIDFGVTALVFLATLMILVPALQKSWEPAAVDQLKATTETNALRTDPDLKALDPNTKLYKDAKAYGEANNTKDAAQKAYDAANKGKDKAKIAAAKKELDAAKKAVDSDSKVYKALTDDVNDLGGKLRPAAYTGIGIGLALALLLFFVPAVVAGGSIGQLARRLQTAREDGSKANVADFAKRYGIPLVTSFVGYILVPVIGQFIPIIWVFGLTSFPRNAKRQAWHDRISKTRVVVKG